MPSEDIGISFQTLDGRGPRKGRYLNTVCHEIYFIIKGSALFYIKDEKHEVKERDVIIIEPNTAHHIEARNLEYITITQPNWYKEQYQEVDAD